MNHKNRWQQRNTHHKGMTLIELCIVIAIIAIVSSIAYPSYQGHILKANRTIAMADLVSLHMKMEAIHSQTGEYKADDLVDTNICSSCQSDRKNYQFSIEMGGVGINLYRIKATPTQGSNQAKDACGILSINAGAITNAQALENENLKCWP